MHWLGRWAAKLKHRVGMVCALMAVATVPGASAWAATIDREPVRATFVRRFSVPVVSTVLGPEIGGRSYALASNVFDLEPFATPSLWWTRAPNEQRWTLMGRQPATYSWLVATDPVQSDTLYTVDPQGTIFRSQDAGATWEKRGWTPCDPGQILATDTGLLLVVGYPDVCRSADGGRSWKTAAYEVIGLVLAPGNHRVVYAFSAIAILRSSDGARSFIDVSPAEGTGAGALAVAPSDANVVYAFPDDPSAYFLHRTDNGGVSWTELVPPVPGLTWSAPAVDPTAAKHLMILGGPEDESAPRRLFESFDGGGSWIAHGGSVNATALRVSATRRGLEIEVFGRRGIFTTLDRGDSWVSADHGIAADSDLELAGGSNGDLYLLHGRSGGVWHSQNGGRTWELRGSRPGIQSLEADPFEPAKLVAIDEDRWDLWWSDDGGRTWARRTGPRLEGVVAIYNLAFDPHRRDSLYASTTEDAWLSADRGGTWSRLTASLPSVTECSQTSGCHESRLVGSVVPDPFVPARFFVDYSPGSFRTEDAGATWEPLPKSSRVMQADPRIENRLYLKDASGTTIFQSDRAGERPWRILLQKPDTQVFGWLTFDPQGRLVAAPVENVPTFLRRVGTSTWERFSVALPYEEDVQFLEPLVAIPGGDARMFLLVQGIGLFRADLPASFEP